MKRSTIYLIILLAILLIAPIIVLKVISYNTSKELVDSTKTFSFFERANDSANRYIVVGGNYSDTTRLAIRITTTQAKGDSGRTLINGVEYEQDTLFLANDSQGEVNIVYEERVSVFVRNTNPRVKVIVDGANIESLALNTSGEILLESSNLGTTCVTDSIGSSDWVIRACNLGNFIVTHGGERNMMMYDNNIGRISFLEDCPGLQMDDSNNIGLMSQNDQKVQIGNKNANIVLMVKQEKKDSAAIENETNE